MSRTHMGNAVEKWVFLGGSLTEGIGSDRVSCVSFLAHLLRQAEASEFTIERRGIQEIRLRQIDGGGSASLAHFNIAGH